MSTDAQILEHLHRTRYTLQISPDILITDGRLRRITPLDTGTVRADGRRATGVGFPDVIQDPVFYVNAADHLLGVDGIKTITVNWALPHPGVKVPTLSLFDTVEKTDTINTLIVRKNLEPLGGGIRHDEFYKKSSAWYKRSVMDRMGDYPTINEITVIYNSLYELLPGG